MDKTIDSIQHKFKYPCKQNSLEMYNRGAYSRFRFQFIGYRNSDEAGIAFPTKLGLNFDWAKISIAMTHVLV